MSIRRLFFQILSLWPFITALISDLAEHITQIYGKINPAVIAFLLLTRGCIGSLANHTQILGLPTSYIMLEQLWVELRLCGNRDASDFRRGFSLCIKFFKEQICGTFIVVYDPQAFEIFYILQECS